MAKLVSAALLLGALQMSADVTVAVHVETAGISLATKNRATAKVVARSAAGAERQQNLDTPGNATFSVEPGTTWTIAAEAPGYVSSDRTFTVTESVVVSIPLWPASEIRGSLKGARESSEISSLRLTYSPASTEPGPPGGSTLCDLANMKFRCVLPVGTFDYSLHAPGFASVFRWADKMPPGGKTLDGVRLVRGASVVGRALLSARGGAARSIRVSLAPVDAAAMLGGSGGHSVSTRQRDTTVMERSGFFQFDGVAPGRYRLTAVAGTLLAAPVEIDVIGTTEARLREPLMLMQPLSLHLDVTPATDFRGREWLIDASRNDRQTQRSTVVATSSVVKGGVSFHGLAPGEYTVSLRDSLQGVWWSEEVVLSRDESRTIVVDSITIRGRVRLGDVPLTRAFVWFGGDRGDIRVVAGTNASGEFSVQAPRVRNDTWSEIDVVSDRPQIRREFVDMKMETTSEADTFRVDLDLPERGIYGQVVDVDGKPVARVPVNAIAATPAARIANVVTDATGSFSFEGLSAGSYVLHAYDGERETQVERVTLAEGDRLHDVRLVMTANAPVKIRVSTTTGPVIGARSWLLNVDRQASVVAPAVTDVQGEAELTFRPAEARGDIVVSAPGLPFTFFASTLQSHQVIEIPLAALGSTLRVTWPTGRSDLLLLHRGGRLPLVAVYQWATPAIMERNGQESTLTVKNVEPGEYALCPRSGGAAPSLSGCALVVARPGETAAISLPQSH